MTENRQTEVTLKCYIANSDCDSIKIISGRQNITSFFIHFFIFIHLSISPFDDDDDVHYVNFARPATQ